MKIGFFSYRPEIESNLVNSLRQLWTVKTFECHLNKQTFHWVQDCDALCLFINDDFDPAWLPSVCWVVLRATGSDRIIQDDKVHFDRIVDYGPQSIAEYSLGLVTQLAHPKLNLLNSNDDVRVGRELMGKKAAILGVGRIGRLMAKYLSALRMDVHCFDTVHKHSDLYYSLSLEDALKDTFVISLHLPLNNSTKNIINDLAQLPKGCILVNVGRSGLINPKVIIQGLQEHHFYGLGLDVFPGEENLVNNAFLEQIKKYRNNENILVTSHVAYLTQEALGRIHDQVFQIFSSKKN